MVTASFWHRGRQVKWRPAWALLGGGGHPERGSPVGISRVFIECMCNGTVSWEGAWGSLMGEWRSLAVEGAGLLHRGRGRGTALPRSSFDGVGNTWGMGLRPVLGACGAGCMFLLVGASPFIGGCLSVIGDSSTLPLLQCTGGEVRWRPNGEWMGMEWLHEQGPHTGMEWHPACLHMCEDVLVSWRGQFHVPVRRPID
jgi:hypothetical protein